jgi:cell wall-associated NlpC family hydrolase
VVLVPASGQADPKLTVDQVKHQVNDLNAQAEQATQQYDAARSQLQQLQQHVSQLQGRIATEQSALRTLQNSMGTVAAAQYRSAGIAPTVQMMLSDSPDAYLQHAAALDELTSSQREQLKTYLEKRRQLDQDKQEAAEQLADLENTQQQLANQKATIESELHRASLLLNSLTSSQRAEVLASDGNGTGGMSLPAISGPVGSIAQAVLSAARSQVGVPYEWGAESPGSAFDCSGFTQWAFSRAGISIGRDTYAQWAGGRHIPASQMQPGDLIFFNGQEHVGIYLGNGQFIHAPHSGSSVRVNSVPDGMRVDGAVRPY